MISRTKETFVPFAPIRLIKPNGVVKGFGFGATSDYARGNALWDAHAAAATGDTIEVLGDCLIGATLGTKNITLHVPSAKVWSTGSPIFYDDGNARNFTLTGNGFFEVQSQWVVDTWANTNPCVSVTNGSSRFSLQGRTFKAASSSQSCIYATGGIISINATEDIVNVIGEIGENNGTRGPCIGVNGSGAEIHAVCRHLVGTDGALSVYNDGGYVSATYQKAYDESATSVWLGAFAESASDIDLYCFAQPNENLSGSGIINLHGRYGIPREKRLIQVALAGPGDAVSTGEGIYKVDIPAALNGYRVTGWLATVGATSNLTLQVVRVRSGTPVDLFSTPITIDASETSTATADATAVINTSNNTLQTNDQLRFDIDTATATTGQLNVTLELS